MQDEEPLDLIGVEFEFNLGRHGLLTLVWS
jgi:hypothetical protein